jgi:hypothetical protein
VHDPKKINNELADAAHFDEVRQQLADGLMEVEVAKLGQVATGGDGTVLGTGRV